MAEGTKRASLLVYVRWVFTGVLGAGFVLALWSCATSPTGRRQLTLLPESQLNQMGAQGFAEIQTQMRVSQDPRMQRYVECIAEPMIERLERHNRLRDWEIRVFEEDSINAFALPGNKIGVHTGIIRIAPSAAHLAAVIGHEIGHVLAQHSNERVSQAILAQEGMRIVGGQTRPEIAAALGIGMQFGVLMPYSRRHETEADQIGQDLMARAGFDPAAAVEFWQIMGQKSGGGGVPEILSTHPSSSSRIRDLRANLEQANRLYARAQAAGRNPVCQL